MSYKKYFTYNRSFQTPGSEQSKLEKSHKSELRKTPKADLKFRSKFARVEDPRRCHGETEAHNVKMYETHFPGFCYLRDGNYRKKFVNVNKKPADAQENSEKIKALLFTDNELDIKKVICLHLLGTQIQNRKNIRRKDGRLCTFIKTQAQSPKHLSFQSKKSINYEKERTSTYDKMLPRYVLEVSVIDRNSSSLSLFLSDQESCSDDDDLGKKKTFQVPLYINNDIKEIVNSALEALEAVNSSKFAQLIALARSPEQLKNLLSKEEIQEFIAELAGNQLISNSNAYDLVMTTSIFDNVPDGGTMEIVAQILEIPQDSGLRSMLQFVRKAISARYEQLLLWNVFPGKRKRAQNKRGSVLWETSRTSFTSGDISTKTYGSVYDLGSGYRHSKNSFDSNESLRCERKFQTESNKTKCQVNQQNPQIKSPVKKTNSNSSRNPFHPSKLYSELGGLQNEESSINARNDSENWIDSKFQECEFNRIDLKKLSNSQRILLGLKVAEMKCRPINMHQFENKKEVDIPSLLSSIIRQTMFDSASNEPSTEEDFYGLEKRRAKKSMSIIGNFQVQGLGNLSRGILSNFRYDVAATENKRRVKEFIQNQL